MNSQTTELSCEDNLIRGGVSIHPRLDRLMKNSPIVRLSEKGYKIAPKSNINRETHGQNANNGVLMQPMDRSESGVEE